MGDYVKALSYGFPLVNFHLSTGLGTYEDIVWDGGAALPSKATLDAWIASNTQLISGAILTLSEFRKRFTFAERLAIDNMTDNANLTMEQKHTIRTYANDVYIGDYVNLLDTGTVDYVQYLAACGLITTARVAQILQN